MASACFAACLATLLGEDRVEGELGFVGAVGLPLDWRGEPGFVVEDEVAVGGGVDAVDAEFEREGAELEVFFLLGWLDGEGGAVELDFEPREEQVAETLALDAEVGVVPGGFGMGA